MPNAPHKHDFPYSTYRDYVSALSSTDNAYQRLGHFLHSSPNRRHRSHPDPDVRILEDGGVTIIDCGTDRVSSQQSLIGEDEAEKEVPKCITYLQERPIESKTRIVVISYQRDPHTGEYSGVNANLLDFIGMTYRIHPEVLMWHFGSDFGLDKRFFPFAAPPIPSALSSCTVCHLLSDHTLFSCCIPASDDVPGGKTVFIFSRNYEFPNWGLLTSRLVYLDSELPLPLSPRRPASRWSNSLYTHALHRTTPEDVAANVANPIEYVIPYAQMILINATFVMDTWAMKVMHPQGKTSANLEVHYDKQVASLNEIRLNRDALMSFTTSGSSKRWGKMLMDYERVLQSTEQQINVVLAQKMTYRAAMASLDESRVGIEQAKRGMEQNARVKRLTQLAFVFIPLSFSTSLFGMNLQILENGTAKVWMVIAAAASVYAATSLLWVLINYPNVKLAWQQRAISRRWPLYLFGEREEIQSSRT